MTQHIAEGDYQMRHRPAPPEYGAPLHNLTGDSEENRVYPDDVYTHPHHYVMTHEPYERRAMQIAQQVRGKPDAMVKIYRSLPKEHAHEGIHPGDWVGIDHEYAQTHGMQPDPKDDWPVISATVPAKHLYTSGDSISEWGYHGPETVGATSKTAGLHGDLPEGLRFEHTEDDDEHNVSAYIPGTDHPIGQMTWTKRHVDPDDEDWHSEISRPLEHGDVSSIYVDPEHRRRGIGSAIWDHAKSLGVVGPYHSQMQSPDGEEWAAKTASVEQGLPNPYHADDEFHHTWFHGGRQAHRDAPIDSPSTYKDEDFAGPGRGHGGPQTNKLLGTHFSSLYSVGASFARSPEPSLHHARLAIKNPAYFPDEGHLDRHIFRHAMEHHPEFADDEKYNAEQRWQGMSTPRTLAERDRQMGDEHDPENPYRRSSLDESMARSVQMHQSQRDIAKSFVERLKSEGHDGIVYGNQVEGPKFHHCAIAFHPDQIHLDDIEDVGVNRKYKNYMYPDHYKPESEQRQADINEQHTGTRERYGSGGSRVNLDHGPWTPYNGKHILTPHKMAARDDYETLYRGVEGVHPDDLSHHQVGVHWSTDPDDAHRFALGLGDENFQPLHESMDDEPYKPEGSVIEALVHKRHLIHHDDPEWDHYEQTLMPSEVRVRPGAPIHVQHVHHVTMDDDGWTSSTEHEPPVRARAVRKRKPVRRDPRTGLEKCHKTVGGFRDACRFDLGHAQDCDIDWNAVYPDGDDDGDDMSTTAALGDLSDEQREAFADHVAQYHPGLDASNPMIDWLHKADHHLAGDRTMGPRRGQPSLLEDDHPHPASIDPYRSSWQREAGANGPDYDNLTFDDLESFGWPHTEGHRLLRAHHPEHGMVGALYYDEKPNYLQIGRLRSNDEHKRRGVATQMMRELESRYPGKPIQHGMRTDDGHAWAESVYGTPIPENLREKQNWTVNGHEAGLHGELPEGLFTTYRNINGKHFVVGHVPQPDGAEPKMIGHLSMDGHPDDESHPVSGAWVHPSYRRRGVGGALWSAAKEMGFHPLHTPDEQTEEGAAWAQRVAGANGPDYEGLTYSVAPDGAEPNLFLMRAHHPEHGIVGDVHFDVQHHEPPLRPTVVNVRNLEVSPEHQRRGVASALMDRLEEMHPDAAINHGVRSQQGHQWASAFYGTDVPEDRQARDYDEHWTRKRKPIPASEGLHPYKYEAAVRNVSDAASDGDGITEGIMIAIVPPEDLAARLAVEDGEDPQQLHITLAYLGQTSEYTPDQLDHLPEMVAAWAEAHEPLDATVQGAGTFVKAQEDGQHVLWASVDAPGLERLHVSLVDFLDVRGYEPRRNHVFVPHMTLSYEKHHVRFLPKIERETWRVDEVWICIAGRWESVTLGAGGTDEHRHAAARTDAGRRRRGGDPAPDSQPGGPDPVGDAQGAARPLSLHPRVEKDLRALHPQDQRAIRDTLDRLAAGDPSLDTHALNLKLKGWYATKASRGHRIIHQPDGQGGIYVGYVGLHDYDKAINRLTSSLEQVFALS